MISVGLVNIDCWTELCVFYFSWKERRNSFTLGYTGCNVHQKYFYLGWDPHFIFSEKCVYTYIFPRCQYSGFLSIEPQKVYVQLINMCPFWNLQYRPNIEPQTISDEAMNIVKGTLNIEPQKVSVELINMCPFWNLPLTTCFIQPQMFLVECSRIWNTRDNQ